jgi:serine phosphatase RsbU (regulator of sigma subunit)
LKSVNERVDLRAEELCKQLVAEVREFAVSKDFSDDVCLIAIEVDHLMKG